MSTINNATTKTIQSLYSKAVFTIPKFQRAYSWNERNWDELWADIYRNVLQRGKEHFVGSLIYYPDKDSASVSRSTNYFVIDGQQRLTTITILMRVLYEHLASSEADQRLADELYEKYIGKNETDSFYLILSKKDEEFFRNYIQRKSANRTKRGKLVSHKALRKCHEFFNERITELIRDKSKSEIADFCWGLKKLIEENLVFVTIDVASDVDGYTIFESINSKRQDLTVSDLLKNYIFLAADTKQSHVPDSKALSIAESNWEKIEQTLDKLELTQYVRHFWISEYDKVYEKELYHTIKHEFKDTDEILRFLDKLNTEVENYVSIVNAEIDSFPIEGTRALRQLKDLRNKQHLPLLLSALSAGTDLDDVAKLARQISAVAARRALIGKNPNELEVFFAENSPKLRKGEISVRDLIGELSEKQYWIEDSIIIDEISTTDFEDQEALAKFVLQEFEKYKTPEDEKTLNSISLEHVMPRSPENVADWSISDELHEELLWNIGNLALIGQKYNRKMSNKAFEIKKTFLRKSEVRTTQSIGSFENWSEKEIRDRCSEIAHFFVNWWPRIR